MGMHLLRQSAQEHTQQQFGSQFGGDIRPEGQNVVHQHRGPLCTEWRKVKKVIDLLLFGAAICPAEALFELLEGVGEHHKIVHNILNAGHCLHGELVHAVMVLGEQQNQN